MVELIVRMPEGSPHGEPAFVTGDAEALGPWRPNAVRLDAWQDGTYRTRLDLPMGRSSHFLVTRGSWRGVESDGHGHETFPREVHPLGPTTVHVRVNGWGRNAIHYHHDFQSQILPQPRSVIVHLPPGYDLVPERRYPVMYMQDGQNLFDAHTAFGGVPWGIDEVAERLARAGECWPVILVGIGNTPDRHREYGPKETAPSRGKRSDMSRGFGRCLVEEIKPFIDRTYRTMPEPQDTGIGGSSLGGLISLHLAQWYPDVFGLCAAMSPSLWWDREYFLRNINASPNWLDRVKVWLDVGGREGMTRNTQLGTARRVRRLAKIFKMRGRHEGYDYQFLEVPDGQHNEAAWGARFDRVLRFLYGGGGQ